MAISMKALAGVRETLRSSIYWNEERDETPISLKYVFTGTYHPSEKLTEIQAKEFVEKAFTFNSIEYFKGEHAKTNSEPIEWGDYFVCLSRFNSKRLSVMQLYKTLQMIDYNTDAKGWLTQEEYENWARKDEYEVFKSNIKDLTNFLAEFLVSRTQAYKDAEWCIE
jgi:hypothetical protein